MLSKSKKTANSVEPGIRAEIPAVRAFGMFIDCRWNRIIFPIILDVMFILNIIPPDYFLWVGIRLNHGFFKTFLRAGTVGALGIVS